MPKSSRTFSTNRQIYKSTPLLSEMSNPVLFCPYPVRVIGKTFRKVDPLIPVDTKTYKRPETWRKSIGNSNAGSQNGKAKLNESQVSEIKWLILNSELTHNEIGFKFGVTREAIGLIQRNKRWVRVPWPEKSNASS